jgi:hypothetical protein
VLNILKTHVPAIVVGLYLLTVIVCVLLMSVFGLSVDWVCVATLFVLTLPWSIVFVLWGSHTGGQMFFTTSVLTAAAVNALLLYYLCSAIKRG